MKNLQQIEQRHRADRWRDIIFVAAAVLFTALSIGMLTSKVVGSVTEHPWTLTVLEGNVEVSR
ncbi:MAG TPA: hypothetical protein VHN14_11425 [Kofleriaceae bacterium]|jgi:ABC-type Fe3+ transport system permease subunit|nr:hypothetical protein [Kofleriaceae bacterium]